MVRALAWHTANLGRAGRKKLPAFKSFVNGKARREGPMPWKQQKQFIQILHVALGGA